jgi:hypothetical protein
MPYSCLCRCPRLALQVKVKPRNFMPGEAWRELRVAERERKACRGRKNKKNRHGECRAVNNQLKNGGAIHIILYCCGLSFF